VAIPLSTLYVSECPVCAVNFAPEMKTDRWNLEVHVQAKFGVDGAKPWSKLFHERAKLSGRQAGDAMKRGQGPAGSSPLAAGLVDSVRATEQVSTLNLVLRILLTLPDTFISKQQLIMTRLLVMDFSMF
jgi:hypothetical protein